ncbi:MAG: hypothetical protein GPOALKHO_001258 [Sodalis sp.]|nr:MAG: hypothetical protein GPOALKHO_001258 [Sodalis sp.]
MILERGSRRLCHGDHQHAVIKIGLLADLPSYRGPFSNGIQPVSSRQKSSLISSLAQSAITPLEKATIMILSICFSNSDYFSCSSTQSA